MYLGCVRALSKLNAVSDICRDVHGLFDDRKASCSISIIRCHFRAVDSSGVGGDRIQLQLIHLTSSYEPMQLNAPKGHTSYSHAGYTTGLESSSRDYQGPRAALCSESS